VVVDIIFTTLVCLFFSLCDCLGGGGALYVMAVHIVICTSYHYS
jgi:hypothetical protein